MTTMTAAQLRTHTGGMDQVPDPEVPEWPRPPRSYPAAYKLRILEEYEQLDKAGKGALLRREGLYTSLISEGDQPQAAVVDLGGPADHLVQAGAD
jgi:transposase